MVNHPHAAAGAEAGEKEKRTIRRSETAPVCSICSPLSVPRLFRPQENIICASTPQPRIADSGAVPTWTYPHEDTGPVVMQALIDVPALPDGWEVEWRIGEEKERFRGLTHTLKLPKAADLDAYDVRTLQAGPIRPVRVTALLVNTEVGDRDVGPLIELELTREPKDSPPQLVRLFCLHVCTLGRNLCPAAAFCDSSVPPHLLGR